MGVRN